MSRILLFFFFIAQFAFASSAWATVAGSLDSSFGGDGKVIADFSGANEYARAVIQQKNGKIAVAGFSDFNGNNDFALQRYNVDGSADSTFGNGGGRDYAHRCG